MSGIGGFKGVSADQDARFSNKQKKLMKSMKFPKELDLKVEPSKVNWVVMFEWVAKRVTELLGVEDEVLIHFIHNKLQAQKVADARELHIDLVPFLEKNTSLFMKELWAMLASASTTASGIPQQILDQKAEELRKKKEIQDKRNEAFRLQRERDREGAQPADGGAPERRRRPFGRERPSRWGRERSRSRSRSRSPQHRRRSPRGRLPPARSRSPKPGPRSKSPRFRDRTKAEPRQSTRRERDHAQRDGRESQSPAPARSVQKAERSPPRDAHRHPSPDAKAELTVKNGNLDNGRGSPPPPGKPSLQRRSRSPSSPEARSPSPRPPPKRRQFPRRTGRARSSSSPSSSPRRPHHANELRRPPSPTSRRERDRGFNGHSRMKQDSRGVHEDSRGGGGPRTRDGYSGRASSPPESGRYRESGSDFRGPPGRSHRVENRPHYNAPSYSDRRVRRDYPPPPPRGGDYYGRREANAHSGYIRGGKVGSSARERRGGGYAYRAASPVVLRSRVEIPERNPSPSPSSEGSPMKSKRKASETPADAPASKHFRESPMERDVQKDGSGSSGAEGDIGKMREKRRKDKKDKKSKRSKKHKKHKKQKKSSKVHKHSSPSSSSGFSDKGGNAEDDKRIEELRKKALESMGKKAWEATGKRED